MELVKVNEILPTEAESLLIGVETLDEFYTRWNHIKPNLEQAEGYMIEYGIRLSQLEGKKFDATKLTAYGKKMSQKQVLNIHDLFMGRKTLDEMRKKFPSLPDISHISESTYTEAEGTNPVEKAYAIEEYTEAFLQEVIEGKTKVAVVGKTQVSVKDRKVVNTVLQKAIKLNGLKPLNLEDILAQVASETGLHIKPTKEWIKTYKANKKRVEKELGLKQEKEAALKDECMGLQNAALIQNAFLNSKFRDTWQAEFEAECEAKGYKKPRGGKIDYNKLGGMDSAILSQLLQVVDEWKEARVSILKSCHPDTGGTGPAMKVMSVVNTIMKDIINYSDWTKVSAQRNTIKEEFRNRKYEEAKTAVKKGEFKNEGEWFDKDTKGECK